jgi:predicted 3-demethylubiquinone-9 3-methyltransferase (glyoxalase superfamily)
VTRISHHGDEGLRQAGSVPAVEFTLDGRPFAAINGGPQSHFDEAVSFLIECADQAEVDHYWGRLTDGGEESMCGWLRDCYGVSWQVVPRVLNELIDDPDEERAGRARAAMLQMRKIDVDALLAAAEGG